MTCVLALETYAKPIPGTLVPITCLTPDPGDPVIPMLGVLATCVLSPYVVSCSTYRTYVEYLSLKSREFLQAHSHSNLTSRCTTIFH